MFLTDDAELVVVAFGSIGRIVKSAVRKPAPGHRVGLVRPHHPVSLSFAYC